jgi:hypothetical protein
LLEERVVGVVIALAAFAAGERRKPRHLSTSAAAALHRTSVRDAELAWPLSVERIRIRTSPLLREAGLFDEGRINITLRRVDR